MSNSFLITGHGRSGTTFLANLLNQSPTWTVLHEPNNKCKDVVKIRQRFEQNNYGEVNSYLRFFVSQLDVRKGVIIRNPYDILLSGINRKRIEGDVGESWRCIAKDIEDTLSIIENVINEGGKIIYFEHMVSDFKYCQAIAYCFDITDVKVDQTMMGKVNATVNPRYSSLPKELRYNAVFDDFIGKYLHDKRANVCV